MKKKTEEDDDDEDYKIEKKEHEPDEYTIKRIVKYKNLLTEIPWDKI